MKVYIAGPLFTIAQRLWLRSLADELAARIDGLDIFLPQEEAEVRHSDGSPDNAGIFRACIDGLEGCDILVAVFDGADCDSGTSFEAGFAYACDIPIIGVLTDIRSGAPERINAMLAECSETFICSNALDEDATKLAADLAGQIQQIAGSLIPRGKENG